MLFIIYMMIEEIQSFYKLKLKYFSQFWSLINLGIIICSWSNVGIYVWRYQESTRIGNLFQTTNGYAYINLQLAVYISDLYIYLIGFCCFFATIKFVYLLRFNDRLLLFVQTLKHASRDLFYFAMMFLIVFMAFIELFYLLFSSKLSSCASFFQTAQMLFQMTLMNFDAIAIFQADALLGPFCFSLFIFLVVFVCMSMFLTIINESFRFVRDDIKVNTKMDQDIFSFMCWKFQRWIGLSSSNRSNKFLERDEQMRLRYVDPIEDFPNKIDQLLEALNRVRLNVKC